MNSKIIVACLVVLTLTNLNAQIKGTTQKGSLFPDQKRGNENNKLEIIPPQIQISYPVTSLKDTVVVKENLLRIQGSVIDESNIKSVLMNNDLAFLKSKEFYNDVLLNPGMNKIIIAATDEFENKSMVELYIFFQKDINAPEIILLRPSNIESQITVDTMLYEINFHVTDETKIKDIFVDNIRININQTGQYFTKVPLVEGKNIIEIQATDIFNNVSEKKIIINNLADLTGPIVKIIEPEPYRGLKIVHRNDVIQVKGYTEDKNGILEVTINNRKAQLKNDGTFNIAYYLQTGDNELVIKAIDGKYNETIDTVVIYKGIQEMVSSGKFVALVIGINSYNNNYWKPLNNAVNDAKEFGKILEKSYNFSKVKYLLDEDATRENIIQELEMLTDSSIITKNDNVVIFYAGHGQLKLNEGYWVPVDAKNNSISNYVSNETVKNLMGNILAKHILLIADACFAGDIFRGENKDKPIFDPNNMEEYYRELYRKNSRIVMTSGGIEEVMDSGNENHSIFTFNLLKELKNNTKKYITVNEIFDNFKNVIRMNSNQKPLCQSLKNVGDEGGEFIFVLR